MDKANIIISIIIVLCIAAAVAAYGITNSDSPIFSDLSSMSASDDSSNGNGIGNNTDMNNGTGSSVVSSSSTGSSGSSSGTSSSGSGSSGSSSSGSGSGTSSSGSGSSGSSSSKSSSVSASTVKSDAWNHISEEGCYPGTPYKSGSSWFVPIFNANGTQVDGLEYSLSGKFIGRG